MSSASIATLFPTAVTDDGASQPEWALKSTIFCGVALNISILLQRRKISLLFGASPPWSLEELQFLQTEMLLLDHNS